MGFLAFLPMLLPIIEKIFPSSAEQTQAKAELLTAMSTADMSAMEAQAKVISAEASGESSVQRNWRPHLMYMFMFIVAYNYIIAPLMTSFGVPTVTLPIPEHMWMLLEIGVGGYIVGRSGEKMVNAYQGNVTTSIASAINSLVNKGR